jgi:iron complex outermembrane receptor protein
MFSKFSAAFRLTGASTIILSAWLLASPAVAADALASSQNTAGYTGTGIETVVVTSTKFNVELAPAKASLNTTEPQTIINRLYIEDSVAPTADYTTLLSIVPSMTGLDINGPGLSDGNVKNTLRGMPDGNFGMTYDGIPFGDTNGPTHHSESYFPASTIGSVNVERGPGNAGNLGPSTYGGSVNMYSSPLDDAFGAKARLTRGSWDTVDVNASVQSGDIPGLGHTRALATVGGTQGSGYLNLQNTVKDNELIKIETEFAPNWTLTFFANRNNLHQHVNDNNGSTPAQIQNFGKQFALQKLDPNQPNYYAYNYQNKITDMDYVRLRGEVMPGITFDDQVYTYAYVNKTVTSSGVAQTQANITANTFSGLGTTVNGVKFSTDVPGYTKQNAYRVWGNILRAAADYDVGFVSGQIRAGLWWEGSATERRRFYFDETQCFAAATGCDPWHNVTPYIDLGAKKANKNALFGPLGAGYLEHSGWQQYSPFLEVEIHLLDGLTLTPGIKYVDWKHTIDAPIISAASPPLPFCDPIQSASHCASLTAKTPAIDTPPTGSFTTARTLYFATANYKITDSWSTYFQYATGVYVPDISLFEQVNPGAYPPPQYTTNYQFGTVFYADNFSFDADVYYIAAKNNYVYAACTNNPAEQCPFLSGNATYKGIEGEGTYSFDGVFGESWLDGLMAFANGSINSAKSGGAQLQTAPYWTAAAGLVYNYEGFKFSLIDKTVGQQYTSNVRTFGPTGVFYKLPAYSTVNLTTGYDFGKFELSVNVNNLFDDRSLVSVKGTSAIGGASSLQDYANRGSSTDQYYFQSSRSYWVTFKVHV